MDEGTSWLLMTVTGGEANLNEPTNNPHYTNQLGIFCCEY